MTIETLEQIIDENAAAADRGDEMAQMNIDWATTQLIELQKSSGMAQIRNHPISVTKVAIASKNASSLSKSGTGSILSR